MKRIGFILKVRPDKIEEYKVFHKSVWPEMRDALTRTRIGQQVDIHILSAYGKQVKTRLEHGGLARGG
jgi:L-rhamnose mutarotase